MSVEKSTGEGTDVDAAANYAQESAADVSNGATIEAVTAVYDSFDDKVDMMLAGCPTGSDDRQKIEDAYDTVSANYQACLNKGFQDDDKQLAGLVKQATGIATDIQAINADLGEIATVIDLVTKAVDVTTQIVEKVVAL